MVHPKKTKLTNCKTLQAASDASSPTGCGDVSSSPFQSEVGFKFLSKIKPEISPSTEF